MIVHTQREWWENYLAQSVRWQFIWCTCCWCRCTSYRFWCCCRFDCGCRRSRCACRQEFLMFLLINCQLLGDLLFAFGLLFEHLFPHLLLLFGEQLLLSHFNGLLYGSNTNIRNSGQLLNGMSFQIDFRQWFRFVRIAFRIEILKKE